MTTFRFPVLHSPDPALRLHGRERLPGPGLRGAAEVQVVATPAVLRRSRVGQEDRRVVRHPGGRRRRAPGRHVRAAGATSRSTVLDGQGD